MQQGYIQPRGPDGSPQPQWQSCSEMHLLSLRDLAQLRALQLCPGEQAFHSTHPAASLPTLLLWRSPPCPTATVSQLVLHVLQVGKAKEVKQHPLPLRLCPPTQPTAPPIKQHRSSTGGISCKHGPGDGLFKRAGGLLYEILMDYSYLRIYRYCRSVANNLD